MGHGKNGEETIGLFLNCVKEKLDAKAIVINFDIRAFSLSETATQGIN